MCVRVFTAHGLFALFVVGDVFDPLTDPHWNVRVSFILVACLTVGFSVYRFIASMGEPFSHGRWDIRLWNIVLINGLCTNFSNISNHLSKGAYLIIDVPAIPHTYKLLMNCSSVREYCELAKSCYIYLRLELCRLLPIRRLISSVSDGVSLLSAGVSCWGTREALLRRRHSCGVPVASPRLCRPRGGGSSSAAGWRGDGGRLSPAARLADVLCSVRGGCQSPSDAARIPHRLRDRIADPASH